MRLISRLVQLRSPQRCGLFASKTAGAYLPVESSIATASTITRETTRTCVPRFRCYLHLDKLYTTVSTSDMERVDTTKRLEHLRALMKDRRVDVYSKTDG